MIGSLLGRWTLLYRQSLFQKLPSVSVSSPDDVEISSLTASCHHIAPHPNTHPRPKMRAPPPPTPPLLQLTPPHFDFLAGASS